MFYYVSFFMLVGTFFLGGCAQKITNINSTGESIVCFGDSLTEGYGATPQESYPSLLAQRTNIPVVNSGRHGETSADGLKRIKADVLDHHPRIVIVEFGGNDFFRQIPRSETFRNIDQMVSLIQKHGAIVVLAQVKVGLLGGDAFADGFRKIARERKALLIPDILGMIMDDPRLKSDQVHPNAEGYRVMTEKIWKALRPLVKE